MKNLYMNTRAHLCQRQHGILFLPLWTSRAQAALGEEMYMTDCCWALLLNCESKGSPCSYILREGQQNATRLGVFGQNVKQMFVLCYLHTFNLWTVRSVCV